MEEKLLRIGHRGAKGYVVENTIKSIEKAISIGIDGVEIDVHCCKSGELVVFHDFTVDRLTSGSGEISSFSLSELKKLKIQEQYTIPTLEEVFKTINNSCLLNIELKGIDTVKPLSKIIEEQIQNKSWQYTNIIVSSFQHSLLKDLHHLNKNIPIGVLTDTNLNEAIEVAKAVNAVAIHPNYTMLTKENVNKIQCKGYKVFTWTVNNEDTIARIKGYNVDGIISDYPDRI